MWSYECIIVNNDGIILFMMLMINSWAGRSELFLLRSSILVFSLLSLSGYLGWSLLIDLLLIAHLNVYLSCNMGSCIGSILFHGSKGEVNGLKELVRSVCLLTHQLSYLFQCHILLLRRTYRIYTHLLWVE